MNRGHSILLSLLTTAMLACAAACGGAAAPPRPLANGVAFLPLTSTNHAAPMTGITEAKDECVEPMAKFCNEHETFCQRRYDTEVARVRDEVKRGETRSASFGTCGPYRYVSESAMGAMTNYFDESGALVGGTGMGDAPAEHCGHLQFSSGYGIVPRQCDMRTLQTLSAT